MTTPSKTDVDLEIEGSVSQTGTSNMEEVAIGAPTDPPPASTPTLSPSSARTTLEMDKDGSKISLPRTSTTMRYPDAFLCPISKEVFRSPVVAADGITYEESAIAGRVEFQVGSEETETETEENEAGDVENQGEVQPRPRNGLYHNRALEAIIDEHTTKAVGLSSKSRWSQFAPWSSTNPHDRPLPDGFYCPITLNLIHNPVIDPEGYSYEKVAIESWIQVNGASPVTRQEVSIEDLRPNLTLAELMRQEAGISKSGENNPAVHPAWKQWREESPPVAPSLPLEGATTSTLAGGSFPMTPEQLESATRARRIHQYRKYHVYTMILLVLALMAWLVPGFATVLLVIILIGILIVTMVASSNRGF